MPDYRISDGNRSFKGYVLSLVFVFVSEGRTNGRNGRLSLGIRVRVLIQGLLDGLLYSWLCWVEHVLGN